MIGAIVLIIVGSSFISVGYYILKSNRKIETLGIKTKATIVDFTREKVKFSEESYKYSFPIVKFTDINGKEVIQKLNTSENPERLNEVVDIIYFKNDNDYRIVINNRWKVLFQNIFIIGGFIFLITGILWIIKTSIKF